MLLQLASLCNVSSFPVCLCDGVICVPSRSRPNNTHLLVQVTELKSLANHVVVGNVSCETKDLFAALPQTVAVDINDLGTIKLSLEVTWKYVNLGVLAAATTTTTTNTRHFVAF